jgi:hypothetical protein
MSVKTFAPSPVGVVQVEITGAGTPASAAETTLATFPLKPLQKDGQYVRVRAWGTTGASADDKTVKIKIGALTLLDSTAVALNAGKWVADALMIRTGALTQKAHGSISMKDGSIDSQVQTVNDGTLNLALPQSLTITGQNEASTANDLVLKGAIVEEVA